MANERDGCDDDDDDGCGESGGACFLAAAWTESVRCCLQRLVLLLLLLPIGGRRALIMHGHISLLFREERAEGRGRERERGRESNPFSLSSREPRVSNARAQHEVDAARQSLGVCEAVWCGRGGEEGLVEPCCDREQVAARGRRERGSPPPRPHTLERPSPTREPRSHNPVATTSTPKVSSHTKQHDPASRDSPLRPQSASRAPRVGWCFFFSPPDVDPLPLSLVSAGLPLTPSPHPSHPPPPRPYCRHADAR